MGTLPLLRFYYNSSGLVGLTEFKTKLGIGDNGMITRTGGEGGIRTPVRVFIP